MALAFLLAGCAKEEAYVNNKGYTPTPDTTVDKTNANNNINADNANTNANNANTNADSAEKEALVLDGTGTMSTHACEGRDVEVGEESTANKFFLTGECKKLTVDGVSNRVTVDKVGEIEVLGTGNKVYYGEGLDGGKPKISKKGTSLIVEKKPEIK